MPICKIFLSRFSGLLLEFACMSKGLFARDLSYLLNMEENSNAKIDNASPFRSKIEPKRLCLFVKFFLADLASYY